MAWSKHAGMLRELRKAENMVLYTREKSFQSYETTSFEIEYNKLFELRANLNLNGNLFGGHPA